MAKRHGDVGVAQLEGQWPKHAVILAECTKGGNEWYPLCQCEGTEPFPVAGDADLVPCGDVTCRDCQCTYRLLKLIKEG